MTIDTRKVSGRRQLRFESCADILAEAERLAAAPELRSLGNWTLGQTFFHLEAAMRMSIDGTKARVPWFIRLIGKLAKKRVLTKPMSPGFNLPAEASRELIAEREVSVPEALSALRAAVERLARESKRSPHPVFGNLSAEEWEQLHCRHAELHLSFFLP